MFQEIQTWFYKNSILCGSKAHLLTGDFKKLHKGPLKSVNLQYNTLVGWVAGTNESSTKHLIFQDFFFIISYWLRALKTLCFYFYKFIRKFEKINLNDFCNKFCKKLSKKNLEHQTFGRVICPSEPANQQTRVLYCRLLDL